MVALTILWLALALLLGPIVGQPAHDNVSLSLNSTFMPLAPGPDPIPPPDLDPNHMGWITKWAAIGDSFTAGIGAGQLYNQNDDDKTCSRYDKSYVPLLQRVIGPSPKKFQWLACSGAKTRDILEQVKKLDNAMDLVVMTAGGNDLCLVDVLKSCIFMAWSADKCKDAIAIAEKNTKELLEPRLTEILRELEKKMKPSSGIVVVASYAQFFHDQPTEVDECAKHHRWGFPPVGGPWEGIPLDLGKRQVLNKLVQLANAGIDRTIDRMREQGVKYRLRFADWDDWASDSRVAGQFCWPGSTGEYPDDKQPNLQFFKPDTKKRAKHDEVKKREITVDKGQPEPVIEETHYSVNESLYNADPAAEVLHTLGGRDPYDRCMADHDNKRDWGFGLPDRWGKFFHPNEKGHVTIASFVLNEIVSARASLLAVDNPICNEGELDYFRCRVTGRKSLRHYAQVGLVDGTYKTYCDEVKPPENVANWHDERVFYEGTPEEHKYSIKLKNGAKHFSKQECINSFLRIVHGCDIYRDDNPLSLKHGGTWRKGDYTYDLEMGRTKRPWPVPKPTGSCFGWYYYAYARYYIKGKSWGTTDHGRALRDAAKSCVGGGLTFWEFNYFHKADSDGYEWEAKFSTPIWVLWRCFMNNKVFREIGAPDIGCRGNDFPY
ncbi:SGNH hydrolase-type esterase domain-containing protein [Aspergillus alliaceus]|uniref:SGNH hydrolase-type esterase domain-containing protein n=1 Tax=Petromyces alliaceus TaxID=209559 RepID=UPI0012A3C4D5|nr:SGNH hydrolase-type esterase domain-containing protein [Aspergillus alliaceus]KAB8232266.1 SGNH hydrolase-type esterase domain-containing protein [Aspergillus alliaceus]